MSQNVDEKNEAEGQSGAGGVPSSEPERYNMAKRDYQAIVRHLAKLCDPSYTRLSDHGIKLLEDERDKLKDELVWLEKL